MNTINFENFDNKLSNIMCLSSGDKPRVLLVNDEPFLLCGYQSLLEKYFEVETAENGL